MIRCPLFFAAAFAFHYFAFFFAFLFFFFVSRRSCHADVSISPLMSPYHTTHRHRHDTPSTPFTPVAMLFRYAELPACFSLRCHAIFAAFLRRYAMPLCLRSLFFALIARVYDRYRHDAAAAVDERFMLAPALRRRHCHHKQHAVTQEQRFSSATLF